MTESIARRGAVYALPLALFLFIPAVVDPDLWGHLRYGLDVLQARALPATDPYSYTAHGLPWINHEWLFEVSMAGFYAAFGAAGLVLLALLMRLLIGLLLVYSLGRAGMAPLQICLVFILITPALTLGINTLRPQLATYLLSAILWTLLVAAENGHLRRLWLLPLVFALWANLHGGFLYGLVMLGTWSVLHVAAYQSHWRIVLAVVLVSGLAVLVTPYGLELPLFLLRTGTVPRPEIAEWQRIDLWSVNGAAYLAVLFSLVVSVCLSPQKNLRLLVPLALTAVAPFVAVRHLPLFAVVMPIAAADPLAAAFQRLPLFRDRPRRHLAYFGAAGAVVLLLYGWRSGLTFTPVPNMPPFPAGAVSLLKNAGARANMAVPFGWGQYVIWHLGPEVLVSTDGRRETVYPEQVYRDNVRFYLGADPDAVLLTRYATDVVLADKAAGMTDFMRGRSDWQVVYEDDVSALFVPRGSPLVETLGEAQSVPMVGDGLRFP